MKGLIIKLFKKKKKMPYPTATEILAYKQAMKTWCEQYQAWLQLAYDEALAGRVIGSNPPGQPPKPPGL